MSKHGIRRKRRSTITSTRSARRVCRFEELEPRLTLSANASPFPQITWTTQANGMPNLTSFPGAPAVIYLDYDGDAAQNISETDFDGTPGVFTPYEQQRIYEHWRGLSDTFSMFNISVTTVQPPNPGSNTEWIAITNDMITRGGFNGVNSFPDPEPSGQSGSDWWAEGYSHEISHGFGNNHQASYDLLGNKLDEYAPYPVDDPLRAGIMGDGSGTIVKWQFGHSSAGVTSIQGDLEAIRSDADGLDGAGDGYRPDDQTSTSKTGATALTVVDSTTQGVVGIIERMTDQDWYAFASAGGAYNIMVGRDNPSPVDVKLSIYGSDGTTLIATDDGDPFASATPGSANYRTMVNDSHLTLNLPAGTYYLKVESHGNYADQGQYIARVDRMKDGWQSEDIGLVESPGFTEYDPTIGQFTVGGSGAGLGATGGDSAHFAYTKLIGDGEIVARVTSMETVQSVIRAGITMRESLATGSKFFAAYTTPNSGFSQQRRTSTDGSTSSQSASSGAFSPKWLRIKRSGDTFTAYYGSDGVNWTQLGSTRTVVMGSELYVGLLSTSANGLDRLTSNFLSTATFTNVKVLNQADIGTVGITGSTNYNSATDTYTLTGNGRGWGGNIASQQDASYVYYHHLAGDGSITAHVASISSVSATSGVMIRESLLTNAKYFATWVKLNEGVVRSLRNIAGGSSTDSVVPIVSYWLKIERIGNVFRSYSSADGIQWTQIGGDQTIAMNADVIIGLMVATGNTTTTNTSTFDNLSFTGGIDASQPLNSLAAPTNVVASGATSTGVNLSWTNPNVALPGDNNQDGTVDAADYVMWRNNDGTQAGYNAWRANIGLTQPLVTGFSIERSNDNVNFQTIGTTAANLLTFTDSTAAGGVTYYYRVRTSDAIGVSTPSAAASATTRAAAVTGLKVYSAATNQLVIEWNDVNGETDYTLQRSLTGTGSWTTVGSSTITQNSTMYANTSGLSSGTQYFYRVITVDGGGNSDTSAVVSGYTRVNSTPAVTFTGTTGGGVTLSWSALSGMTSYAVYRGLGSGSNEWELLTPSNIATTSFTDTGVSPLTEYHYRVIGFNANGAASKTAEVFGSSGALHPVTSPWSTQDIGAVGGAGAADLTGGTFTLVGGGADIWGGSDEFRYVYMPMSGDGFIQAHISDMKDPVSDYSRAGLMIRETTATNSAQTSIMLHDTYASVRLQSRTSTGAGTGEIVFPTLVNSPYWLRLERSGNTITGKISPNGTSWTTVGSYDVTMGADVLIGMALTPRDDNYLFWAKFDNVSTSLAGAGSGAMLASGQSVPEVSTLAVANMQGMEYASGPMSALQSSLSVSSFGQERRRALDDALAQLEFRQPGRQYRGNSFDSSAGIAMEAACDDDSISTNHEPASSTALDRIRWGAKTSLSDTHISGELFNSVIAGKMKKSARRA